MSQPAWAAWIEIDFYERYGIEPESQPAWAAWIEMPVTMEGLKR